MSRLFLTFIFTFTFLFSDGQNTLCDDCDTPKTKTFTKNEYNKFKKDLCHFKNYTDSKDSKKSLCMAKYFYSIGNWPSAIEYVKQAYGKGTSTTFKFVALKLTVDIYKQAGDIKHADLFQSKVDEFIKANPDIEK